MDPETSKLHFFLTILHIDKHITRVDFSEVDFIVNLNGNVLETQFVIPGQSKRCDEKLSKCNTLHKTVHLGHIFDLVNKFDKF